MPDLPGRHPGRIAGSADPAAGVSVQYHLGYLSAQVRDYGLPDIVNRLIPLVEYSLSTPAGGTQSGTTTTATLAPGLLYEGGSWQIGAEALIPATGASGNRVGFILQMHLYLDNIFPLTLGKPILGGAVP